MFCNDSYVIAKNPYHTTGANMIEVHLYHDCIAKIHKLIVINQYYGKQ